MTIVDDFKKQLKQYKISDDKDLSAAIEKLTDENKASQLGKLNSKERKFIFTLISANELFFNNSERINRLVEKYLLLSKSEGGIGLELISGLYKTDINNNTNMQLGLNAPRKIV